MASSVVTNAPTLFAVVSKATASTTAVVAAVTGRTIVLDSYVLVATAAVGVNWEDGTTDISGVMQLGDGGTIAVGGGNLLATSPGAALAITLDDTVQVSGHISYHLE